MWQSYLLGKRNKVKTGNNLYLLPFDFHSIIIFDTLKTILYFKMPYPKLMLVRYATYAFRGSLML